MFLLVENENTENNPRPRRAVRILEIIHDENDQLVNFKVDNRKKHAASTSTPSGTRRQKLKAPHDVSIIDKPESKPAE
jgi:hypothetical protein